MILAATVFTEIVLPLLNIIVPALAIIAVAYITNRKTHKK